MEYSVRRAGPGDLERLVRFTLSEAEEAEGRGLDRDSARRGIQAALEDESLAAYWVVETAPAGVVGNISVVKEWSNWNAGYYWWIQSLFIEPGHRGRGLLERLVEAVREAAGRSRALELRLYVHINNERAVKAYRKAGFIEADYRIMRTEVRPRRGEKKP